MIYWINQYLLWRKSGSLDVAWFDSSSIIDSERDDEFYSVRDGIIFNIFVFFFFFFLDFWFWIEENGFWFCVDAFSLNGSESTVSMSSRKDLNLAREVRPQLNLDGSSNESGGGGGANACLPRLASTGTGLAGSRRKLISKFSFKLREAQADLAVGECVSQFFFVSFCYIIIVIGVM